MSQAEPNEQEFIEAMKEIAGRELIMRFDAASAVVIFSTLQLALRHPANIGPSSKIARRIAQQIETWLVEQQPLLKPGLEAGWNEALDYKATGDDETRITLSVPQLQRSVWDGLKKVIIKGGIGFKPGDAQRLADKIVENVLAEATAGRRAHKGSGD